MNESQNESADSQLQDIDPELSKNVQALRAFATIYNLLDKGHFTHSQAVAVVHALDFVRTLHGRVKDECLNHPQADQIEELRIFKESQGE